MKLISLGTIDKKFMIYLILNIIITIIINLIDLFYFTEYNYDGYFLKNSSLNLLINFCSLVLFGIPELIIKMKYLNKKKENEEEGSGENVDNKIVYIYNNPKKSINCKAFWLLIFLIIVYYIFDFAYSIIFYWSHIKEYFMFMNMIYLFLFFLCFKKMKFYKHQYLSIIIIILMGSLRNVLVILFNNLEKEYYYYLFIIIIFILPIQEPLLFYNLKNYMEYKYYSPYFICFLVGLVNIIISIILIIFVIQARYLKIIMENIKSLSIFIFIFKSILKAVDFFLKVLTINYFSLFHIIIFVSFDDFINNMFRIFSGGDNYENSIYLDIISIIIIIIAFSFEMFAIFVFVEIIELNFCGLSLNLKQNIIDRANRESTLIFQIKEEEEDNNLDIEFEPINDNNSEY